MEAMFEISEAGFLNSVGRIQTRQRGLDQIFYGDNKDKLEVFRADRPIIERAARAKYLARRTEPDGSVLIRTLDL